MKKTVCAAVALLLLAALTACSLSGPTFRPYKTGLAPESGATDPSTSLPAGNTPATPGGDPTPSGNDPTTPDPSLPVTPTPVTPTPVTPTPVTPTPVTPTPSTPTPPKPEGSWKLRETADAGLEYQNQLTFLGDSTTAHLVTYKVLPDKENTKQVWVGDPGKTITYMYYQSAKVILPETGEKLLIKEAAAKAQPKYLVVTLGVTGGVSTNLTEENFKKIYRQMLNDIIEASPQTSIIVQSIYPVNKENNQYEKSITIDKIVKYNVYVEDIAREFHEAGKAVWFSDAYASLADSEGYLPKNYGNGDGLHLSAEGYEAVLKHLRTHALTLQ